MKKIILLFFALSFFISAATPAMAWYRGGNGGYGGYGYRGTPNYYGRPAYGYGGYGYRGYGYRGYNNNWGLAAGLGLGLGLLGGALATQRPRYMNCVDPYTGDPLYCSEY